MGATFVCSSSGALAPAGMARFLPRPLAGAGAGSSSSSSSQLEMFPSSMVSSSTGAGRTGARPAGVGRPEVEGLDRGAMLGMCIEDVAGPYIRFQLLRN